MVTMRRMLCFVLAAITVCLSVGFTAAAEDTQFTVTVTPDKAVVTAGNTVTFLVVAENINAEGGLLSLDIPFRFDDTVFEYCGAVPIYPDVWENPDNFSYLKAIDGLVWLRILNDNDDFTAESGCADNCKMGFYVTLRAKEDAAIGTSSVTTNGDGGFLVISGTAADGKCSVIYGYGNGASVTVGEFVGLIGDANLDGSVDNLDSAQILKHDAGLIELSGQGLVMADVNGDGEVDTLDAAAILKYDAGLIFGF